jgi:hypothetical protein
VGAEKQQQQQQEGEMSLDFNLTKVKDYLDLCYYETDEKGEDGKPLLNLRATTDIIIWGTMSTGIGHLKNEAACREFYQRYCEVSWAEGYTHRVTLEDVLAHMGLHCNVCKTSEAKWRKKLGQVLRDRSDCHMRSLKRDAEKAA